MQVTFGSPFSQATPKKEGSDCWAKETGLKKTALKYS